MASGEGSGERTLEIAARRVRKRVAWMWVPFVAMTVTGLIAAAGRGPVVLWFLATAVGLLLLSVDHRYPRRTSGALQLDGRGLRWNGRILGLRGQIRDAIAYTNSDRHGVRMRFAWSTEYLEVDSHEEADGIVEALGLDTGHAVMEFGGWDGKVPTAGVWIIGGILLFRLPLRPSFDRFSSEAVVTVLTILSLEASLVRRRWKVGSDGLLVMRGVRRVRFIPYAQVEDGEVKDGMLRLRLKDGGSVAITLKDDRRRTSRPVVGANALATLINKARARLANHPAGHEIVTRLERGRRDAASWVAELRGLAQRPASYREDAPTRESLWSVLEDAGQPVELRAAAATALQPELAPAERARVRVAASACASPRLRVAFDALEAGDEERLEEAMEKVAAEARREALAARRW